MDEVGTSEASRSDQLCGGCSSFGSSEDSPSENSKSSKESWLLSPLSSSEAPTGGAGGM